MLVLNQISTSVASARIEVQLGDKTSAYDWVLRRDASNSATPDALYDGSASQFDISYQIAASIKLSGTWLCSTLGGITGAYHYNGPTGTVGGEMYGTVENNSGVQSIIVRPSSGTFLTGVVALYSLGA
tara:strand:+ start:126 stop:509 length:384 start_codon:yes stop_codon:yes gene_type:complete